MGKRDLRRKRRKKKERELSGQGKYQWRQPEEPEEGTDEVVGPDEGKEGEDSCGVPGPSRGQEL